jgi:3-dehydroquinate synthase
MLDSCSPVNIRVETPDNHPYYIFNEKSKFSSTLDHYQKHVILCDENTEPIAKSFFDIKWHDCIYVVPPGEQSKSLGVLESLCEFCCRKLNRNACIVCFGGGVIGDLGGFLGAIVFRGIDVIQVPTSLLAMVDSSVGGKTAINLKSGKNLVGAFKNPVAVYVNPEFLCTLPEEQWFSGWGEVFKSAALSSQEFFLKASNVFLKGDWRQKPELVKELIFNSIKLKRKFVQIDFYEKGPRKLLNLGHTIGHALESYYKYKVPHGTCVLEGMLWEAELGYGFGYTSKGFLDSIGSLCNNFPIGGFDQKLATLIPWMKVDKKNKGDKITFALLKDFGTPAVQPDGCVEFSTEQLLTER